jgi:adenosine deaminase
MLRYYNDIRLHPIKALLTNGVKVSISPDDPSVFGIIGVSVDYYMASVGNLLGKIT